MSQIRTRIAPSPTGYPHIGTIYQAMFDYVFAQKTKGKFIVRIEDTDQQRYVKGAEEIIYQSLDWFKLESDENPQKGGEFGPYRSSERLDIYKKYALELVEKGHAYYCFCTKERLDEMRQKQEQAKQAPMYDKHCLTLTKEEIDKNLAEKTPSVIRMKIPENKKIKVKDVLLGEVEFDSNLIDHQVIIKSDGYPTYHLASVVDDYLMKITQVFRGQEWLPSYPKHVLLYEYLGWHSEMPQFIHLPVILNNEGGGKLSKRHGHSSVDYYKSEGFLPEAILNYLANIVWNHPEKKEIYPFTDLAQALHTNLSHKIEKVDIYSQGPRFDLQKLTWMNGEYIRLMSDDQLAQRLTEFFKGVIDDTEKIKKLAPLAKERIKTLRDFEILTDFMFEKVEYDIQVFNKVKVPQGMSLVDILQKVLERLEQLPKPWKLDDFQTKMYDLAQELKIKPGDFFQLLRIAFSGKSVTPPLFESMMILGEEETKNRIKFALEFLKTSAK